MTTQLTPLQQRMLEEVKRHCPDPRGRGEEPSGPAMPVLPGRGALRSTSAVAGQKGNETK